MAGPADSVRHDVVGRPRGPHSRGQGALRGGRAGPASVAKVFSPNGVDIGRRLVSAGWALAYRRYSKDYVAAENEARKARRGMWRGTFVKPWEWRASSPPRRPQGRGCACQLHRIKKGEGVNCFTPAGGSPWCSMSVDLFDGSEPLSPTENRCECTMSKAMKSIFLAGFQTVSKSGYPTTTSGTDCQFAQVLASASGHAGDPSWRS